MYNKNEIKQVIFRLDFAENTLPNDIIINPIIFEKALKAFKTQQPDEIQTIQQLTADPATPNLFRGTPIEKITKVFSSVDGKFVFKFNTSMLVFTALSYSTKSDFEDLIKPIISTFFEIAKNCLVSRVGLRFVNIFNCSVYSCNDFSKKYKSFLGNTTFDKQNGNALSQSIIHEEMINDDLRIRVNYGLYNPTMPSELKNKDILLDIDTIHGGAVKSFDSVLNIFQRSQSVAKSVFEQMISDSMRKKLG